MTDEKCVTCAYLTEKWKESMWTENHLGGASKKVRELNFERSHEIVASLRKHIESKHPANKR